MVVKAQELQLGAALRLKDEPFEVLKVVQGTSASGRSAVELELKNLYTSSKTTCVLHYDDKIDNISLDKKEATLSFISGDAYTFMDAGDFTMYELSAENLDGILPFIEDGMPDICNLTFYEERLLSVELPEVISRKVASTDSPSGTSSTTKSVKLGSGTEIQVPNDIEVGQYIDINTRSGSCVGRSKE